MRLLADENVSGSVIRELRRCGHDVLSVKESMRGEADRAILERANLEGRLLVTHDKDVARRAARVISLADGEIVTQER